MDGDKAIEIFSGNLWEAQLLQTLLMDEDIESFLKNSVLMAYAYVPDRASEVKLMVLTPDFQRAQKIKNDYLEKKNQTRGPQFNSGKK
jgi:hypothetical protein